MLKQHLGEKTTSNMLSTFRPFVFNIWTGRGRNRPNPRRNRQLAKGYPEGDEITSFSPVITPTRGSGWPWTLTCDVHRDRDTSVVLWQRTLATIQFQTSSLFAYIAITAFRCIAGARSAPGDFFSKFQHVDNI